jgi:TatD DNase family protein
VIVDTHCHLDPTYYPSGERDVLEEARAAGVGGFVVIGVGETLEPARLAIAIAEREPGVAATVGVHPHDASHLNAAMVEALIELAGSPKIVAIGEIGLDYHYMHSPKETQLSVFRELCQVARRLRTPIVVHTREAPEDTLAVLEEEGARDVGGIIHCFSEDLAFARRALDLDFDLSFSGVVTFKNARSVHEVAAWAPLDRILVETDSPYLAPVPFRGKPCRPSMVVHTARRVAELRGVDLETVAAATTANAERRLRFAFSAC